MAEQLENFTLALSKLKEFVKAFDGTEVHRAGIILAFEFTFEQCWKAIQKAAAKEGGDVYSPKKAFEWAFQAGWVKSSDEEIWLEMVSDRNLTTHTYRANLAKDVADKIMRSYVSAFEQVLTAMSSPP